MVVTEKQVEDKSVYLCEVCELGYSDKETAQACEDHCTKYNSCSLEITRKAIYRPKL